LGVQRWLGLLGVQRWLGLLGVQRWLGLLGVQRWLQLFFLVDLASVLDVWGIQDTHFLRKSFHVLV